MKKSIWYGLCLLFVLVDQGAKLLALQHLSLYQPVSVFPGLNWTLVYNSGSAFGFLSHYGKWSQYILTLFGVVMTVVLTIWILRVPKKAKWELLALTLILSGAIGNLIDRVRFGYVIDFIDVYFKSHHWPVFNIADSAICMGAILLFFYMGKKN